MSSAPLNLGLRILINAAVLTSDEARHWQREAQKNAIMSPINHLLSHSPNVDAEQIQQVLATALALPLADLDHHPDASVWEDLPWTLIANHAALPLKASDQKLWLAMVDPTDLKTIDTFKFHYRKSVETQLISHTQLQRLLDKRQRSPHSGRLRRLQDQHFSLTADAEKTQPAQHQPEATTPIVHFIDEMLREAVRLQASDLHLDPFAKETRVRFRIDGLLSEITRVPIAQHAALTARLKVMATLDISEKRMPQDGRFQFQSDGSHDCRLSTCPTIHGEKLVIRLLPPPTQILTLPMLGLNVEQTKIWSRALKQTQGLILVTGPTGSGKTLSLYAALSLLNQTEKNIITIENPVEITLEGINQVAVNEKLNWGFSKALRTFLRQDPDVIMLGEIRDAETATTAIRAAQTGHLVLSTMHTNHASASLQRLQYLDVPLFSILSAVHLIVAQRLARRLCLQCRQPLSTSQLASRADDLGLSALLAEGTCYEANPQGCSACHHGYHGRIGFFETLTLDTATRQKIFAAGLEQALPHATQPLWQAGLEKVKSGLTSLTEIERVIQVD